MKKHLVRIAVLLAIIVGVALFTPIGDMVVGTAYFVVESGRYLSREKALAVEIRAWPQFKFEELVGVCTRLASARKPEEVESRFYEELHEGVPIPHELSHLNPQRVWIAADSVTIELMHMMDSDATLTVAKSKEGIWTVTGHFGDFMNKPELLWPKNEESNQSVQTRPTSGPV